MKSRIFIPTFLAIASFAQAQGIISAHLEYEYVKNDEYTVTLYVDRTCNTCASKSCVNDSLKIESSAGTLYAPFKMISQHVAMETCDYTCSSGNCQESKCNQLTEVYREEHTATINLANQGCEVTMSVFAGGRFEGYTNLKEARDVWVYAKIFRCTAIENSLPSVQAPAKYLHNRNDNFSHKWTKVDRDSFSGRDDSVHFSLADPLRLPNVKVIWNTSNYTYKHSAPINYLGFPSKFSKADFPKGIHLNSETGRLQYQPTLNGNFVMAFLVKEYRKGKQIGEFIIERGFNVSDIPSLTRTFDITLTDSFSVSQQDTIRIPYQFTTSTKSDSVKVQTGSSHASNTWLDNQISTRDTLKGHLRVSGVSLPLNDVVMVNLALTDPVCKANLLFEKNIEVSVTEKREIGVEISPFGCDSFKVNVSSLSGTIFNTEFEISDSKQTTLTKGKSAIIKSSGIQNLKVQQAGINYYIPEVNIKLDFDTVSGRYDTLKYELTSECYDYKAKVSSSNPAHFPDTIVYTYSGIRGHVIGDTLEFTYRKQDSLVLNIKGISRRHCFIPILDSIPTKYSDLEDYTFRNAIKTCKGDTFIIGPSLRDTTIEVRIEWKNLPDSTLKVVQTATIDTLYQFTLFDRFGCDAGGKILVQVAEKPVVEIADLKDGYCPETDTILLKATPHGGDWEGKGIIDTAVKIYFSPALAGTGTWPLKYTYKDTESGCGSSDTKDAVVYKRPEVKFYALDSSGARPFQTYFYDSSGQNIKQWLWEFGDKDGSKSLLRNTTFTYNDTGRFDVALTITDENGCKNRLVKKGYIHIWNVGLGELPLTSLKVWPTVVTESLNIENANSGENADYLIYSHTGQLVDKGIWNGQPISVERLQEGVYVIILQPHSDGGAALGRFVKF